MSQPFRFALPPSIAQPKGDLRVQKLAEYLTQAMERPVEVLPTHSYRDLTARTDAGDVDVGWAPPFVAARLESKGHKVLVRGVRRGASTYRAALVAVAPEANLEWVKGRRAAWVDSYSVSGYLLPLVFLKSKGIDPERDLYSQTFAGSFLAAVQAVADEEADFASVFAPPSGVKWAGLTGLEEIAPHLVSRLKVLAFTAESPNSGLVASPHASAEALSAVTRALTQLHQNPDGAWLLEQLFQMDGVEDAPPMGYHALYRLALASL